MMQGKRGKGGIEVSRGCVPGASGCLTAGRRSTLTRVGDKTDRSHWESTHQGQVRLGLPSPLNVGTANTQRLLRRYIRPGDRVLEIGFAPGKQLAWVAAELGARVSGVDFSPPGIATARALFSHLGIDADLRCEDAFQTTFPDRSFDVVYSLGVIEHFDDPTPLVARHMALVAPGGIAVIAIPNYGGVYGRLQRYFDPENLTIHNLSIMSPEALRRVAPSDGEDGEREWGRLTVETFAEGRVSPWAVSWGHRWPRPIATAWQLGWNAAGLLQPWTIAALAPWLVLTIRRHG